MICTTIREGDECVFMTAKGCSYNEGACLTIIDECKGCGRIFKFETGEYCTTAPNPSLKSKNGNGNIATHVKTVAATMKQ